MAVSKRIKKDSNKTYAVVVAEFNKFITERLLDGCLEELKRQGIAKKNIQVVWVPGAFEIPVAAQKFAKKRSVAVVIALGCVIRGETYHFELVANSVAQGILKVSLDTGKLKIPPPSLPREVKTGQGSYQFFSFKDIRVQGDYENVIAFISNLDSGKTLKTAILARVSISQIEVNSKIETIAIVDVDIYER